MTWHAKRAGGERGITSHRVHALWLECGPECGLTVVTLAFDTSHRCGQPCNQRFEVLPELDESHGCSIGLGPELLHQGFGRLLFALRMSSAQQERELAATY